jgi:lysophospholipase L1-like esterase
VVFATYAHPCTEVNLERHPDLFVYLPGYAPTLTFTGVRDAFRQYNEAIRSAAAEEHAVLVDAEREIPPDPALFVDHVHYNAAGADAFARAAAAALLPELRGPETLRAGAGGRPTTNR